MPQGFFEISRLKQTKSVTSTVPKCGACGFYKHCSHPKMNYSGKGRRKLLIVAEWVTKEEDETGRHLDTKPGRYLEKMLAQYGIDMRRDCWLTHSMICNPTDLKQMPKAVEYCRPAVFKIIEELEPIGILLLGQLPVQSVITRIWRGDDGGGVGEIARWQGWKIPSQKLNAWVCPVLNPITVMAAKVPTVELHYRRNLKQFAKIDARPWEKVPDYSSEVECIQDVAKAARIIDKMIARGGVVAFDYENNMLKPDSQKAAIACASVCWEGKKTIAFPWIGEAVQASKRLLHSERIYKIASNLKHEERWTLKEFGKGVRNWHWDTMLAAHALDCREGITGLKFQSFVRLGVEGYDDHLRKLLGADGGNVENDVFGEIETNQLLLYCGLDSLLEYHVAMQQRKEMGL